MNNLKFIVLIFFIPIITGCATTPSNMVFYSEPTENNNSSLVSGSELHRAIVDNQTTYLIAVDGVPVKKARESFSKKVKVISGVKKLTVAYTQGQYFGLTELQVNLKPDHSYTLKSASTSGEESTITDDSVPYVFWLEDDSSKETIGEKRFAKVSTSGGGYVPIFIPSN
jgi:hypothetical protein